MINNIAIALSTFAAMSQAAVFNTYTDGNCGNLLQEGINVWDNTEIQNMRGFSSFMITYPGGSDQEIVVWSDGGCRSGIVASVWATATNQCIRAIGGDGVSHGNCVLSELQPN